MTALATAALLAAATAAAGARAPAALSDADLDAARVAWRYFERNYHPETGLVSAADGYPGTSLWDVGSTIFATLAARELGLLDGAGFDQRISAALRTLATLPLFDGELPNKAYDAATARMTDYANQPAPRGIGASAVDIGRLASALQVVAVLHPERRGEVARVLRRWRSCRLVQGGELHGAIVDGSGEVRSVQEGRLGYEQYAAHAFGAMGLDVARAERYDRFAAEAVVLGVRIQHDSRDRRRFGAVDALVSDPWFLDAFEFGLGDEGAALARSVFEVQKRRWERTRVVTAASEDHVDRPPWFVYGGIWADGQPWRTVDASGDDADALRGLSTKAAFALATLHPHDPYAAVLLDAIARAKDPERGWFAGVYERGGVNRSLNSNTNGVILEALLYKALGPLHDACEASGEIDEPGACPVPRVAACPVTVPASASIGPIGDPAAPTPTTPSLAPAPREPDLGLRLDGTVYGGYRGLDGPLAGAVATVWPWRFTYLRIGGEATPYSRGDHGPSRFLWGLGYDDWHPGTFFLHVDNWGPLRPEDSTSLNTAVHAAELNVGYRLPQLCVSSVCAAPLLSVVTPFAGGPYFNARMTVTVHRDWFVMGGVGWTVPGVRGALAGPVGTPQWRVVYGFGRASWSPGSIFVTYYDWGPSYRDHNGVLAIGVNWGFR